MNSWRPIPRRTPPWTRRLLLAGCLLPGCLAVGCSSPTEQAEHHHPEHQPESFESAVERVHEIHSELLAGVVRAEGQLSALEELRDVARWLPTLAADTDLPEPAWNQVDAAAAGLQQILETLPDQDLERRRRYEEHGASISELMTRLRSAAAELENRQSDTTGP